MANEFTKLGAVAGGGFGAAGFIFGPLVGLATMAGSVALGAIGGKVVQKCSDDCHDTSEHANEVIDRIEIGATKALEKVIVGTEHTTKKINKGITKVNHNLDKAINQSRSFISLTTGGIILLSGVGLAFGLWSTGINCNPECDNMNVDLIRYASIVLSTSGIGLMVLSGIKSIY